MARLRRLYGYFILILITTYKSRLKRFGNDSYSPTISVVIPVDRKDFSVLPEVLRSLHQNSCNPISEFILLTNDVKGLSLILGSRESDNALQQKCAIYDESTVISKSLFAERYGITNRIGWHYQQYLKFYFALYAELKSDLLVLHDADTVWLRPHRFATVDSVNLGVPLENHRLYKNFMKDRLCIRPCTYVSFVCHHIVVPVACFRQLVKEHYCSEENFVSLLFSKDCDKQSTQTLSEYDIVGTLLVRNFGAFVNFYLFSNKVLSQSSFMRLTTSSKAFLGLRFQSLSAHER